jgi:protein-glucosylgalactosylhydroxylysine glucosidase
MMAGGWDGSEGDTPGFPKNGKWIIKNENFNKMP